MINRCWAGLLVVIWYVSGAVCRADIVFADSMTVGTGSAFVINTQYRAGQFYTNSISGTNINFNVGGIFSNATASQQQVTFYLFRDDPNVAPPFDRPLNNTGPLGSATVNINANSSNQTLSTTINLGAYNLSLNEHLWLAATSTSSGLADVTWMNANSAGGWIDYALGTPLTPSSSITWGSIPNPSGGSYAAFVSVVPEPGTLALGAFAALGGAGGWWIRRRGRIGERQAFGTPA